jgi:hypothetical protein
VNVAVGEVESVTPSLVKSQAYCRRPSSAGSGSVEPVPLNVTVSGVGPCAGDAPMTALGGWLPGK